MSKNIKRIKLNIIQYISNFVNIFILLILLIKVRTFPFFKTIPTLRNRYYIITPTKIIFLNNDYNNYDTKVEFIKEQMIDSEEDYEKISYGRFNNLTLDDPHLLIIKDYVYALSDSGNIYCNVLLNEINGGFSSIIPLKILNRKNYFIIGMINTNNQLLFYLNQNAGVGDCSYSNLFSKEYDIYIDSKSMSCHYNIYIICFYNYSNELFSSIFNVNITDFNDIKIEYSSSYKIYNGGAKVIKSIFSSNLNKFFVCYINEVNNCYCLIYDKNTNNWGNPTNYLNNCINKQYSLNLQYFDSLNYYILSCFQTEKQFSFIKLNNNFEIIDEEENKNYNVSESLIEGCTNFSLGSLVNDTGNANDNVKVFGICNSVIKKYEIQKAPIIPTIIPTTKLTTISKQILTTIPTTTLTTIINKISTTVPTTTLTTIINKIPTTNPTTINKIPTTIPTTTFTTIINKRPTTIPTTTFTTIINKNPTTIPTTTFTTIINKNPTTIPTTTFTTIINNIPTTIPATTFTTIINNIPTTIPTTTFTTIINNIPTTIPTTTFTTIINKIPTTIPTTTFTTIINNIPTTIPTTTFTTIINKIPTIKILTTALILNQNKTPTTLIRTTKLTTNNNKIITTFPNTSLNSTNKNIPIITIKETQNKTKEDLLNNIDEVMKNYTFDKIYEIFGNDYNIKISPINAREYQNISTYINFANCENILRIKNNVSSSSTLTVYQIEIDYPFEQSLNKRIEYAVFNENKTRLDLSVCQNEKIEISYQLAQEKVNQTKVNYYSNLGIDVFDIKNEFFHDVCYPYSERDSDIILKDRISDIYENYSMCDNNCEYNGINYSKNTIICICDIKTNFSSTNEPPNFDQMVLNTFKDSNLAVIKCHKLVLDFKNKFNNIGFWIFLCLITIHIPIYLYYCIYNISSIQKYIISEMNKFGYLINVFNPIKKPKSKKKLFESNHKKKLDHSKNDISEKIIFKDHSFKKIIDLNKGKKNKNKKKTVGGSKSLKNIFLKGNNKKDNNKKDKNNKSITYTILNQNYFIILGNKKQLNEGDMKRNNNISSKYYSLIHIDANNSSKKSLKSNIILDNYNFKMAIKNDRRSFWRIFYICLLAKENIMNIIFFKTPLDLLPLRFCLFIFNYSCDLALNTIFYTNESISDKYHYEGNSLFLFLLVNNIVQIIISSLVSMLLINSFQHMIDSRSSFEDVFKEEENKLRKDKDYKVNKKRKINIILQIRHICLKLKNKIIIFFILEFLIMIFFFYFVTAFCDVYKKTQICWIYDFFTSFLFSFFTEIFYAWILAIFYCLSIRYEINLIYKVVIFFYNL